MFVAFIKQTSSCFPFLSSLLRLFTPLSPNPFQRHCTISPLLSCLPVFWWDLRCFLHAACHTTGTYPLWAHGTHLHKLWQPVLPSECNTLHWLCPLYFLHCPDQYQLLHMSLLHNRNIFWLHLKSIKMFKNHSPRFIFGTVRYLVFPFWHFCEYSNCGAYFKCGSDSPLSSYQVSSVIVIQSHQVTYVFSVWLLHHFPSFKIPLFLRFGILH